MKKQINQSISLVVSSLLIFQQSLIAKSIVVDTNAPKQNQANIDNSRNNIPIVNIVKPNEKGLSHNKFSDYNVNKEGVILNNSNQREVNTELAGYIYGNENLKQGTAKTILNEVTSKNRTQLKGFTEIAGDKANVVVANPNGIYINGAGFINTNKATITTGNPNIINGEINSFEVKQGEINIDGNGLNLSNVNKAELYAQTVKLNAKIQAQDLDIVTGKNSIAKNGTITNIENLESKDDDKPTLSLDSSSLGGIYANKINLIGTQKGVGVNLPIEIMSQYDLKLSADGKIVLDKVISQKNIDIKSDSSDINSKTIYAKNVNIEAKKSIKNEDVIASKINIDLKAKNIVNENLIASGVEKDLKDSNSGNLNLQSENLENKKTLYAKDNIDIKTDNLENISGNIQALKDINITSKNIDNENGTIVTNENLNIQNTNFKNQNGTLQASKNLLLNTNSFKGDKSIFQGGQIDIFLDSFIAKNSEITSINGDLNINSNEVKLNNSKVFSPDGNINLNSKDSIEINNINLQANKVDIKADNLENISGNIQALKDINITSKNIDNSYGAIVTNENLNINSTEDGFFNNLNSILQSGKNLVLNIFNIKADNSNLQASNIDIKANNFEAKNSNILSTNGDLNLSTNEINIDGTSQTKNILYSTNDILINTNKLISNNLLAQANNNIFINSTNIDLKNSKLQSVAFIGEKYVNGYKQGDINLTTSNLNLNNTTLASNDINIKNQDNQKLSSLIVENSTLDTNRDINITTLNLNSKASKYIASNNIALQTDKSVVFLENIFNGLNLNLSINENLTLDKSNSFLAQDSIVFNTKSLTNNAQFVSNGNLTINTSDFIVNNSLLNAKNILNLNATNYILNNDSSETMFGIRGAFTNLNTKLLTNYGFISSLYDMNIKVDDLINYGAIASANAENKASNLNIEASNLTNYNIIYSNDNINFYIKNSLKNITDNNIVNLGSEKAVIFAANSINIQGDKNKTLRTDEIINDKAIIQTQSGDINIFAKKLDNLNDEAIIDVKDNGSKNYRFKPTNGLLYLIYENYSDEYSSYFYTSIGEQTIIEQLKKEDIENGIYYNIKNIGSSCGKKVWGGGTVTNNCYDKDNKNFIINNITYNKNEYEMKEVYTYDEYNTYTTWELKYKDKSSEADKLTKYAYAPSTDRVLVELEKLYEPLSSIMKPVYTKTSKYIWNQNYVYALEITNPDYYNKKAVDYKFNYNSQIDYFLNKPKIEDGAKILSGKNINFDVLNVDNYLSKISAKNNITFNNTILNNQSENIYQYDSITGEYKYCYKDCNSWLHSPDYTWANFTPKTSQTKINSLDSIVEAGNKISGNLTQLNNENLARVNNIEFTTYTPTANTNLKTADIKTDKKVTEHQSIDEKEKSDIKTDKKVTEHQSIDEKEKSDIKIDNSLDLKDKVVLNPIDDNYTLPANKYSLFTTTQDKTLDYLVESNPLYTNLSNFIGSSYFLEKINYQGDRVIKRLGDAGYETKLVSDAIFNQTGQRFLNSNFQSENEQFVALMNNAINLSNILDLELGKPLNSSQLASLKEDIVWMEEQIVNNQTVLVPVLYLAKDYEKLDGAIIQANSIDLNIKDSFVNSGTIKTNDYLNLNANAITNSAGVIISNGKASLISNEDFINKNGGLIKASDIQIASLNGSVINETFVKTNNIVQGKNDFTYTNIGKTSSIEATNGNLVIQAKNDITNIGANLSAKDSVLLQTQSGDINQNAIRLENGHNIYFSGGFDKAKDVEHQTSNIEANNIILNAGKDINLEASKLNANNQINLNASNDVNILALNSEYYRDTKTTSKGTFSKSVKRDMEYRETVNSGELNANDIVINASNDVNIEASKLKAQDNIIVNSENGDLNLVAKEYREGELHMKSKSSFGGLKKSLDISSKDVLKLDKALLETQAANVVLTSGKDINILASEVNSGADIQLKALEDILIASQSEYLAKKEIHEKSSFNLAGLVSLIVPVETTLYSQEISKNNKVNSTNVSSSLNAKNDIKIDSGSTTIVGSNLEANNIDIKADTGEINIVSSQDLENTSSFNRKIEVGLSDITSVIKDQYKDLMKGNTKLKFEVGSAQFDEVDQSSQKVTNNASNLKARESIDLDSLSDINIVGSNLQSEDNITLSSSVGDVNILSSTDSYNQNIDEKQGSAKLSITVQNEYAEIAQAVDSAVKSAEQLKQTKEDYSNYKSEVKKLENNLSKLKQSYKNKEVGVDYSDIEDLSDFIDNLKSQEKYYVAAISSATADLASKTAAIATQAAAAYASSGTLGFSAGLSLDVNGNKSKTTSSNQTSNASNLEAKNISINTNKDLNTNVNITGSNVIADENLYINTNNLNVKASQNNYNSTNDSKSINGSVSFTMYGGGGGTAGLGFGKSNSSSDSFVNNNSNLQSNNMYIDVKNDANFVGANLRANDTLNLNVGNNLNLESLRDEYSSNSKGFNVNAGVGFGSGGKEGNRTPSLDVDKTSSVNSGISINNGVYQSKQTNLSSITADKANITVGGNTNIKGALIASGNFTEDGNFVDNKNLNFTTDTLTFANSSNNSYSSNKSVGTNINYNFEDKKLENGQEKPQQKGVSSVGYNSENSLNANASKTLATLGQGNITIKDVENSDDLTKLNQDTQNINKDLYSSSTGTKVDATLDTRLLTVEGREQIAKEFEEMNKNMNIIAGTLPDANSDNPIEATVGEVWNGLTKYLTLGIIPSNENNGGILAQIPVLTGVDDSQHKVLQVVNEQSLKYNEQDYIKFEDSSYYKSLSDEDKKLFDKQNLYISKEPIIVTKDTATYQNSINGMMNNAGEAIKNGLQQTGQMDIKNSSPVELNVNVNPSYGFLGDLLESFVDKSGIGTTGIAKQTGGFVYDTTTSRGNTGSNFAMHSQANAIVYNGITYVQTTTGFQPIEYFKIGETEYNTPSFVSFGSPMNRKTMYSLIDKDGLGYTYSGAYTKNGDFVGEVLGGNKGNNGQADILDKINILNATKLFTNNSPHSTYNCQDFEDNVKCGYKQ